MAPRRAEHIDDPGDLLQRALELALGRARRDAHTRDAPPPPSALRPLLRFNKLPPRARETLRRVLDEDDEFRARVAEGVAEDDLDRPSWLFLTRPDGWREELELLEDAATSELADERATREEQRALRRVEQLSATVQRLRDEIDELHASLATAERVTADERSARLGVERERADLSSRVEELVAERAATVRSLKETEAVAAARLAELRQVQDQLSEALQRQPPAGDASTEPQTAAGPAPSRWDGVDPEAVAHSVGTAARAARSLADALDGVARSLQPALAPRGDEPAAVGPDASGAEPAPAVRPPRRTPMRLRRGLTEDSAEGLEQLLRTPGVVAVVDGYNVTQEGWPVLEAGDQRATLLPLLGGLQARTGAVVHVVFDGDAEGGRPSVSSPLPVRVHFSPADLEADDVILDMVRELPTDVPVVVVSSDRRVADGARRLGANAVRSRHLLALLGR